MCEITLFFSVRTTVNPAPSRKVIGPKGRRHAESIDLSLNLQEGGRGPLRASNRSAHRPND